MAFIRQHMMAGDAIAGYGGQFSKRKGAMGGTKSKAARHRMVRFRRMAGDPFTNPFGSTPFSPAGMAAIAKSGLGKPGAFDAFLKGAGSIFGKVAPIAGAVLGKTPWGAIGQTIGGIGAGAMASLQRRGAAPTGFGPMPGAPMGLLPGFEGGGGGSATNKDGTPRRIRMDGRPYKRPSMNALNPRALVRSARRFDGFKKAIKRVNASLPGGMKFEPPGARRVTSRRKR